MFLPSSWLLQLLFSLWFAPALLSVFCCFPHNSLSSSLSVQQWDTSSLGWTCLFWPSESIPLRCDAEEQAVFGVSVWPCFKCLCVHACLCLCLECACRCVRLCHLLFCVVCDIRPDSAEGFSSCPSAGSRNGEKDWENDSTTSSTPSNTEYTGRHNLVQNKLTNLFIYSNLFYFFF